MQINSGAVIGETKFVYLDENAETAVAPYMSQPLESAAVEEAGDIIEADDVECNLPLEEMKLLKEEQEWLDADIPEVEHRRSSRRRGEVAPRRQDVVRHKGDRDVHRHLLAG